VNVFDLDQALVGDYERFARSFTQIRAKDIRTQVEHLYFSNRFCPEPLISIKPHFEHGAEIKKLVAEGSLHTDTDHFCECHILRRWTRPSQPDRLASAADLETIP
jgi:hypothetical protein